MALLQSPVTVEKANHELQQRTKDIDVQSPKPASDIIVRDPVAFRDAICVR